MTVDPDAAPSDPGEPGAGSLGAAAAAPGVLVILGASGDLTKRLLMPALYNLACAGLLPEACAVVGMARRGLDTSAFRAQQRDDIRRFHTRPSFDEDRWRWLESRLHYVSGDFADPAAYERLRDVVLDVGAKVGAVGNTLLYLAISPDFFDTATTLLHRAGFADLPGARRIIVEKPFGKDLASAEALNRALLSRWREEEIYRIDHYLGKETVQNLLAFRLANALFAPLWNSGHIDNIQISALETVGVEGRGEYYDHAGVVRDMLQNHLMQLVAYICMEPPASLDPAAVREEKSRLLRAVRLPTTDGARRDCVRGQYGAGTKADGSPAIAYQAEPKVAADSVTPTFAALTLQIDNQRWAGTPVYVRTGKSLWKRGTEIVVQFKASPGDFGEPNLLIFHIQPSQGVEIRIQAKRPGPGFELQRAGMRFDYADAFEAVRGTGYEVLLWSAFNGDPTLFSRTDFVEDSWRIIQPILDAWSATPPSDFPNYAAGTWGPLEAHALLAKDGRRWHECIDSGVLTRSPLFAAAPPVLLNNLALAFRPLAVAAGTTLMRAGDPDGDLYVVCRGELEAIGRSGERLSIIGEGQCFGELAVLHGRPRSATVRAISACDLLVLESRDFRRILADFPQAEASLRDVAARRRFSG